MTTASEHAAAALNREYLNHYPAEAARELALVRAHELGGILQSVPVTIALQLWQHLPLGAQEEALLQLPEGFVRTLLGRSEPQASARLLLRLPHAARDDYLRLLDTDRRHELQRLMEYPADSAGGVMDPRFLSLRGELTVREALRLLQRHKPKFSRQLFLTDADGVVKQMVDIQALSLADGTGPLQALAKAVPAWVLATASRDEVVEQMEQHKMTDLPVVDIDGRLMGIIRQDALVTAVQEEASADIQTMVGASKDERALSSIGFVVRKRLPWLQINLLTAFLAASVVGIFESTIASFTALAVLLPVVAGQSGNTGAQALAVTMRGLALREIGTSHWRRVTRKEIGAAFINGIAVALTTAVGVYFWSGSYGLGLVITFSMIISMTAAAFSGVIIPVILSSLGQDPAQSSSIILTTVTDVVGFFSFLGIATLLTGML
ncbi:hypothetical protein Tel_09790 [Candidatus Tenderia electrophaga]|jgi:magnesium transporter|uniref:CBS domain-containing protein n=1 Tax=Candidatus Tenderia electrophaga TaxID=1748243 RepID=A0A0S2TE40_9GAMM|nr:hypothetical protein Tel_09790 [Candidatus Tenderia electrophaga]